MPVMEMELEAAMVEQQGQSEHTGFGGGKPPGFSFSSLILIGLAGSYILYEILHLAGTR